MKNDDFIHLTGLKIRCIIGIFEWERKQKQDVLIDLKFPCDIRSAARNDRIEDAVDYKKIAKSTISFVEKSGFQLVETLAEELSRYLMTKFGLREIFLRVSKPGAIRGSQSVGVEIHRSLPSHSSRELAFFSLGSNLSPRLHLEKALEAMDEKFHLKGISHAYKTTPVGFKNQPLFWNMVVAGRNNIEDPKAIRDWISNLEERNQRVKTHKSFGPRTLDVDLILFGDSVVKNKNYSVPHPDIEKKAFVLYPLLEICPNLIHPKNGKSMIEISSIFKNGTQRISRLPSDTFPAFQPRPLF